MILFCDTSALVKFYLAEAGSTEMAALAETSSAVAVCRIAWAEIMAALARRARENPGDAAIVATSQSRLRTDWPRCAIVEITQPLVELAGEYADIFALRGYDSVQLAAAHTLKKATDEAVLFACFDTRLRKAAETLGMPGQGAA